MSNKVYNAHKSSHTVFLFAALIGSLTFSIHSQSETCSNFVCKINKVPKLRLTIKTMNDYDECRAQSQKLGEWSLPEMLFLLVYYTTSIWFNTDVVF